LRGAAKEIGRTLVRRGVRSISTRQARIMGAPIAFATEADVVETMIGAATGGRGCWTITTNLDHLRCYHRQPGARTLIDEADLLVADGKPLVWASAIAGTPLPGRVCGSDLAWSLSEGAAREGVPLFLLGGRPGVADRVAEVLAGRYPELRLAGTLCPPFGFEHDEAELARIEAAVLAAAPGLVLLGLPFPKQEELIRRLRPALPGASFVGVGAAFDFVTGDLVRAPAWTQRLGLEWAHRLLKEPRRLARRYLVQGLPFALRLLGAATHYRLARPRRDPDWGWAGAGEGAGTR
jgi:N-acetylglucosaminyldiphosphoundecaprenol N-acetyl-beta-D-mannosaminyltransferase